MNLQNVSDDFVFDYMQDSSGFELDSRHKDNLTYRKQLAYEGKFSKVSEGLSFEIDGPLLDHWKNESEKMLSEEVEIPLVINHTENPEHRRGDVIGFERGTDNKGRDALYCLARFADTKAAEVAKTAQVSLYSPKQVASGSGKTYNYPVKHVAITDYPVIAGMERFQAIAASLSSSGVDTNKLDIICSGFPNNPPNQNGDQDQNQNANDPNNQQNNLNGGFAKSLANQLGLEVLPQENDNAILQKIILAFNTLKQKAGLSNPANQMNPMPQMPNPMMNPMQRPNIAAGLLQVVKENRELKLSNLLEKGKITSAVYKTLKEKFLTDNDVAFSLSEDSNVANLSGFNSTIEALNQMPEKSNEEKSGFNGNREMILSFDNENDIHDEEKNPLLKDAARMAKEALA